MAASTRVHVIFKPAALMGQSFQMVFHLKGIVVDPNDVNLQAIISAINACTRAVAIEVSLSVITENAGSPTSSATYVNEDKGLFKALDDKGQAHNWRLPSLKTTLLNADKETIILSTGAGSDLVDAITTYALSAGGDPIDSVPFAYRTENRKRIKAGAIT